MFSQTAEYALRAVVALASKTDRPWTNQQLAATTKVPSNYLSKLMQSLRRAEIIHAQRGVGGGFRLQRRADEITVLDVIRVVEPVQRIHQCPLGLEAHRHELCSMHRQLDDALASTECVLSNTTIQQLLDDQSAAVPLDVKVCV
ncbi:Rrf2 family transcriptional regulator [Planctomycetales bacterium ZRK34]|nr:Rrf2 family transcriptional regulator [Planctomycetales bacterium ZRK34]